MVKDVKERKSYSYLYRGFIIQRGTQFYFSFNFFYTKIDETRDDQREPPRERQKLQLQPRSKPLEEFQPLSGSSSSVNNVAANAEQSLTSNPDDSSSPTTNQQIQDSSINENRDEYQQKDSHDSISQINTSDEQSTVKPSRGASASIFGGAKPVDTAARELEIEKKMQEFQIANSETSADNEEKRTSQRLDIFY
jgi:hypothetical protein